MCCTSCCYHAGDRPPGAWATAPEHKIHIISVLIKHSACARHGNIFISDVPQFPSTSQLWSDSIHRGKLDILYIEIKHIFQAAIVVYERLKNSFLLNNTLRPEARRLAALRPADPDMKRFPVRFPALITNLLKRDKKHTAKTQRKVSNAGGEERRLF